MPQGYTQHVLMAAESTIASRMRVLTTGAWAVVEADEYDGSVSHLPAILFVVTRDVLEHMTSYGNTAPLQHKSFCGFD